MELKREVLATNRKKVFTPSTEIIVYWYFQMPVNSASTIRRIFYGNCPSDNIQLIQNLIVILDKSLPQKDLLLDEANFHEK
jgi:hypothetical protein